MSYKSSWECRREGERKFERNPFARHENPYPKYGSYDDTLHRRDWDDGFRSAERREEERKEEERKEEENQRKRLEWQRTREREENRRMEEEKYEDEQSEEEESK